MNTRRDWIKTSLAMAAGLPLGSALVNQLMAAPVSATEKAFYGSHPLLPQMKIRLGSNENPYGPSEKAKQAIHQTLSEANRYPFQAVTDLREILAQHEGVSADHILIGAGSGDLLCATGAAFSLEGGRIISGFPTFPMLMNYAEIFKATWDKVNVNEKLEYDYDAVASRIKEDTRLVFICNPNNPTGTLVDHSVVKAFTEDVSTKIPVFADEAYLEFLEPAKQISMVELVKKGSNVIVSRTFSKIHGLAGLRIGYIVAKPEIVRKIQRNQPGIPNNQLAIAAAKASLGDTAFMDMSRKKNNDARKILTDYLDKKGYFYGKSHTNFVMFDAKSDAQAKLSQLAQQGIAIRVWDYNGMQWLRVSVGTSDEMKTFIKAYDQLA